jgi:hypothetical protein
MDLMWIGFFFLLCPSKYLYTSKGWHPFHLCDIQLKVGGITYMGHTVPIALLQQGSAMGLTFTMQKNGIPGEVITLTHLGNPVACPIKATTRRIHNLCTSNASATMELYCYYDGSGMVRCIANRYVTAFLQITASLLGLEGQTRGGALHLLAGATALLKGKVPIPLIKLIGRWRSNKVFCYLHAQSPTLMGPSATTMLGAN